MGIAGWFDAFRDNGGPTWYGEVRTPATADSHTVSILTVFIIFYAAFLVIFPGIRREKWASFFTVTVSLYVGAAIQFCISHPQWHSGEARIAAPYRSFTSEKLDAILGVNFGLVCVNVTLRGAPQNHTEQHMNYNERFNFFEVKSMQKELEASLHKGLPYPILSVVEYLSVDRAGFIWGRHYRLAGYYTYILLWLAFSLWIMMVIMVALIPQYFSRTLIAVGSNLWLANLVYILSVPPKSLVIPFPGSSGQTVNLTCSFCSCFWIILGSGALCVVMGVVIRCLELYRKDYTFATFLQVDFDELEIASRKKSVAPRRLDNESLETNCNERGMSRNFSDGSFISAPAEMSSQRATAEIYFDNNNRAGSSGAPSLSYQDISSPGAKSTSSPLRMLCSPNSLAVVTESKKRPDRRHSSAASLIRDEGEESPSVYLQVHPAFAPTAEKISHNNRNRSSNDDSSVFGKRKPLNSVSQSVSDLFVSGLSSGRRNEHYETAIESTPIHGHQRWPRMGAAAEVSVSVDFNTDPTKQKDLKRRLYRHSLPEDPADCHFVPLDVHRLATVTPANTPVGVARRKSLGGGKLTESPVKRSTPVVLVTTSTPGGNQSVLDTVEPDETPRISPRRLGDLQVYTGGRSGSGPPKPAFPETFSPSKGSFNFPQSSDESAGQARSEGRRLEFNNNNNDVAPMKKLRRIPMERLASADEETVTVSTRPGRLTSYHL